MDVSLSPNRIVGMYLPELKSCPPEFMMQILEGKKSVSLFRFQSNPYSTSSTRRSRQSNAARFLALWN